MAGAMIPVSSLIGCFQRMLAERWAYAWDGAEEGRVSCAGAFVWAYRQHGLSLYHGSNRMARVEVEALIPIGAASLVPGMAAFKRREPGERGYALPSGYQPGGSHCNGDMNDYYHVGLIDEDVTRVLNAQGAATGFVSSPIGQGWTHVGYLRQVDYAGTRKEETIPVATMEIYAANGKAVNLRKAPSATAARLAQLPVGARVTLLGESGGWAQVTAGARTGWVMREFLRGDAAGTAAGSGMAAGSGTTADIEERLNRLEERVAALEGGHG